MLLLDVHNILLVYCMLPIIAQDGLSHCCFTQRFYCVGVFLKSLSDSSLIPILHNHLRQIYAHTPLFHVQCCQLVRSQSRCSNSIHCRPVGSLKDFHRKPEGNSDLNNRWLQPRSPSQSTQRIQHWVRVWGLGVVFCCGGVCDHARCRVVTWAF